MDQHNECEITCTGRDGHTSQFRVSLSRCLDQTLHVRVLSIPPPTDGEAFELTLTPASEGNYRVSMIAHHGRIEYMQKGIPDRLIPMLSSRLSATIRSSRTSGPGGECRTPAADKMWRRLVCHGIATYDETGDVFSCSQSGT